MLNDLCGSFFCMKIFFSVRIGWISSFKIIGIFPVIKFEFFSVMKKWFFVVLGVNFFVGLTNVSLIISNFYTVNCWYLLNFFCFLGGFFNGLARYFSKVEKCCDSYFCFKKLLLSYNFTLYYSYNFVSVCWSDLLVSLWLELVIFELCKLCSHLNWHNWR